MLFRGKKFLKLQFIMIAIFFMIFNVCLLSAISYAAAPLPQTPTPAPVTKQPPKIPIQTTPKDALKNCYTDRYGQMHCPNSGNTSTPAGPLGAACKTSSGASGIWVVTSSASNMICATTGDTCYTPSGGMGKVWGTASSMICGAKGDYCPSSTGAGKVFDMGGSLACLGLGNSCTRTLAGSACTGCKVVGAPGSYMTFDCARNYVTCPTTAQASIQLVPTNGQAGVPVQVGLFSTPRNDTSAIYCDYSLKDVGKQTYYSIPCNGAYANNLDSRYRACTAPGSNTVQKQVACDAPGRANGTVNPSVINGMGSDMSIVSSAVTAAFLGSANDAARQNALCNYSIAGFVFKTKIPCNSLKKAASPNTYYCY
ncbi:MAG: hypothetical protein H6Q52_1713 [Deltaproteobacteria bacterium]|nr:hypothetical protein [Deltaproteobacteria bacterium]